MTAARAAMAPPQLDGYTYVAELGTGGYADVYLYEQIRPRRRVAVKVLLAAGLTDSRRAQFTGEADLMALVSAHPYIVTIFAADVAADGRPYLVMEYYPRPHLGVRAAAERLSVPEVLRIGVQLAGAVESAHRLGILHRDIKPANVLTSQFGRPGLTDFGISAAVGATAGPRADDDDDRGGMSIPWSAPEVFRADTEPDERSDVYALGATVWHLLVGRSPFDLPGADNRPLAMMRRIETDPLAGTGRDDVPASLERVLDQAMRKKPAGRFGSAYDFALALQAIQQELQLAVTPVELPESTTIRLRGPADAALADAGATRFKPLTVQSEPAAAPMARSTPPVQATISRPTAADVAEPVEIVAVSERRPNHRRRSLIALAMLLGLGAAVAAAVVSSRRGKPTDVPPSAVAVAQDVTGGAFVAEVEGSAKTVAGGVVRFAWSVPDPLAGDFYLVTRTDQGPGPRPVSLRRDSPDYEFPGAAGARPCVEVVHVRDTGRASEPATICAGQ